MDPGTAAFAFVGFAASLAALTGLAVEGSRTVYGLYGQLKDAPVEIQRFCSILEYLNSLKDDSWNTACHLDDLDQEIDPLLKASWSNNINRLRITIDQFRDALAPLRSLGPTNKRKRIKLIFSDKRITSLRKSLCEDVTYLTLLQSRINSSHSRLLLHHVQESADKLETISRTLSAVVIRPNRPTPSTLARSSSSTRRALTSHNASRVVSQQAYFANFGNALVLVRRLPMVGTIRYERKREYAVNPELRDELKVDGEESQKVIISLVPPAWLFRAMVELSIDITTHSSLLKRISAGVNLQQQLCTNSEIMSTIGLVYKPHKGYAKLEGYDGDPEALQKYITNKLVGVNDMVIVQELGIMSLLEVVVSRCRRSPDVTLQLCKVLIRNGAQTDIQSTEYGSPLYIAIEGGLEIRCQAQNSAISWYPYHSATNFEAVKPISRLLSQRNSGIHSIPAHNSYRSCWSGEHGWLVKLLKFATDVNYLRETFIDHVDYDLLLELDNPDRWLVAILNATLPGFHESLVDQLCLTSFSSLQTCPLTLDLNKVLCEMKSAASTDRCYTIGAICRLGTVEMLQPFLKGYFDLNERVYENVPGLYNIRKSYLQNAAMGNNVETMRALIAAGARVTDATDVLGMFFDGYRCSQPTSTHLIEAIFGSLAPINGDNKWYEIASNVLNEGHNFKFKDRESTLKQIVEGLVDRGFHYAACPVSKSSIMTEELWSIAAFSPYNVCGGASPVSWIVERFRPDLEYLGTSYFNAFGVPQKTTTLGAAVKANDPNVVQQLLFAGGDISMPILGGVSALELSMEIVAESRSREEIKSENFSLVSRGRKKEEIFEMLVEELRSRGYHHLADEAVAKVNYQLPPTTFVTYKTWSLRSMMQTSKRISKFLDFLEPFYTVDLDGILFKAGVATLFLLALALGFVEAFQKARISQAFPRRIIKASVFFLLIGIFMLVFARY